ncbi:MAG: hypothetical protein ACP5KN_02285 [Armatimonadota bacterium]
MESDKAAGTSKGKRLAGIVAVLLLIAVAVNWPSIVQIARGERTLKQVVYGITRGAPEEELEWSIPAEPIGSEDAKVEIEMFLAAGDPCHVASYCMGKALGTIDPERIRVAFRDTTQAQWGERFGDMQFNCMQGMAVNGKSEFSVPAAAGEQQSDTEEMETVVLTPDWGWSFEQFHYILDQEFKESYGTGLAMTPSELEAQVQSQEKACMDRLVEEAKQRDQSGA